MVDDRAISREPGRVTTKYLLPCSCGEKIPVEPRQAGQTISCTCGTSLEVPPMLQIKRLERVEPAPEEAERAAAGRRGWGAFDGLALLGGVILASSIGAGIWLFVIRPQPRTLAGPDEIREAVNNLPPQALWRNWRWMRATGLDPTPPTQDKNYPLWCRQYWLWMSVIAVIGLLGLALTVTMLSLRIRVARARPPSSVGRTG